MIQLTDLEYAKTLEEIVKLLAEKKQLTLLLKRCRDQLEGFAHGRVGQHSDTVVRELKDFIKQIDDCLKEE